MCRTASQNYLNAEHDTHANAGIPLDLAWVNTARVNRSAVDHRRVTTLPGHRTVKQAWLLRAITLIDLTTPQGDDTPGNVQRLCAKALRDDLLAALGAATLPIRVCAYPELVPAAARALSGSGIPVASIAAGFPASLVPFDLRVKESNMRLRCSRRRLTW